MRQGGITVFPSAVVTHETIPIKPHETRFSITGYMAGADRRYLDAADRTLIEWRAADAEGAAKSAQGGDLSCKSGCRRFKAQSFFCFGHVGFSAKGP